ncbi:MAG: hypothetical protein IH941_05210 [Acidobacteria bacterium]|nr:hypothetical protein [Acidobacteriota bacterium]
MTVVLDHEERNLFCSAARRLISERRTNPLPPTAIFGLGCDVDEDVPTPLG